MPISWKTNQIMYWNGVKVSDHGRDPLQESYEIIERKSRMVNGSMRRYLVAKKKNWQTSWENLPSHNLIPDMDTVDGGMSANDMETFWLTQAKTPFVMQLRDGQGNITSYTVILSEFDKEIVKRGAVDWCNVSVTLEEV